MRVGQFDGERLLESRRGISSATALDSPQKQAPPQTCDDAGDISAADSHHSHSDIGSGITSARITPVDHHRAVRCQNDVARMQVQVQHPVITCGTEPFGQPCRCRQRMGALTPDVGHTRHWILRI